MLTAAVRRARLSSEMPHDVDAILVTDLCNVRYLTGFTGSNAAVVVRRDGPAVFATDGRYVTQAAREVPDLETVETRAVAPGLLRWSAERSVRRLAVEADHLTVSGLRELEKLAEGVILVPLPRLVEPMRMVKDADEIAALRTACAITDVAFAATMPTLRAGVTERDVAWSLWSAMREAGADAPAFDSIVAFGPHSAIPHHQPTNRSLAAGDLVKLDFGARYGGYHADMTRTVVLGPASDWQVELHATVADAQHSCREAARPGATAAALGALAQERIEAAGHVLVHGLGHGVGLQIHEDPFLMPTSTAGALSESMCVTVEPGIYLPGRGGVRIEDTVLVNATGNEPLTTSARELLEI